MGMGSHHTARAASHNGEPPTPWRPNVVGARNRFVTVCVRAVRRQPWGAPLECTEETLQWLLDTVAAQGVTRISLHTLNLIASRKR